MKPVMPKPIRLSQRDPKVTITVTFELEARDADRWLRDLDEAVARKTKRKANTK